MRSSYAVSIIAALSASSCAGMKISDYSAGKPVLELEKYFAGHTVASGLFEDRFGKTRRQFVVTVDGTVNGDTLTLDENFVWNDGEKQRRVWSLKRTGPNSYEGRTPEVIGVAHGSQSGNAFNFNYDIKLKVGENKYWKVHFNDWMFLQPSGVIINRAYVSRWGFDIGSVTISFQHPQP